MKNRFKLASMLGTVMLSVFSVMPVADAASVSSSSSSVSAISSSAISSSATSSMLNRPVSFAATSSNDGNTSTAGYEGKNHVTVQTQNGNQVPGLTMGSGVLPHFSVDDDIGKCYCYDWQLKAPDIPDPGLTFNRYNFWDGMKAATNKTKEDQVAAAMMGGYHLNKNTGTWEVAPEFQQLAQSGYKDVMKDYKSGNYTPDPSGTVGQNVASVIGDNYTLQDFEQDVTQSVIWKLDGASDAEADLANRTAFGKALYNYAISHPMDEETADANNVNVLVNGQPISANNPLTIDSNTLKSQTFTFNGYNGAVSLLNKNPNIEVVNSSNGSVVTNLVPGQSYYLQAKTPEAANNNQNFDLDFQKIAESHYFSVVDQAASSTEANNKYQNMVNLATSLFSLPINYVFAQSSSSSSSNSSSSSSSSVSSSNSSSSSVSSSSTVSSTKTSSSTTTSVNNNTGSVVLNNNVSISHAKKHGHGLPFTGTTSSANMILLGMFIMFLVALVAVHLRRDDNKEM